MAPSASIAPAKELRTHLRRARWMQWGELAPKRGDNADLAGGQLGVLALHSFNDMG